VSLALVRRQLTEIGHIVPTKGVIFH
jgi:hypothetical protein